MKATINTSEGNINIDLFMDSAPKTVTNFFNLATGKQPWYDELTQETKTNTPFYSGLIFHRIIDGFMIQGGCPNGDGRGGPGYEFDDEIDLDNHDFSEPYVLAMANAGPGTNGSQFFITVVPTPHLDGKHTIFGKVSDQKSKEVIDKISKVPTDPYDKPYDPIMIEEIQFEK